MSLVRVQQFSVSLDGYGTGDGISREAPMGHAQQRLHSWMFETKWGRRMMGKTNGTEGFENIFLKQFDHGIGAEIMGAGKFGYPGWEKDTDWKGWWGENPPFHTPVFVLTHHKRDPIELEGGTTFHFLDCTPQEALSAARQAANGLDIRIGGGPTVIRNFLAEGLIDHMHLVIAPIILGRGVLFWDGLEDLEKVFEIETVTAPSGFTHIIFNRTGAG